MRGEPTYVEYRRELETALIFAGGLIERVHAALTAEVIHMVMAWAPADDVSTIAYKLTRALIRLATALNAERDLFEKGGVTPELLALRGKRATMQKRAKAALKAEASYIHKLQGTARRKLPEGTAEHRRAERSLCSLLTNNEPRRLAALLGSLVYSGMTGDEDGADAREWLAFYDEQVEMRARMGMSA